MTRALCAAAALASLAACFVPSAAEPPPDAGSQAAACVPACLDGEVCVEGACQRRSCDNVRCLAGSTCVRGKCYPTQCPGGACQPGEVCDGRGCVEAACAGVSCTFGACVDGGCPPCSRLELFDADAGRCRPKGLNGAACTAGEECSSGFCTEGVCCDSVCGEACESCASGACTLRPALHPGEPLCFPGRCNGAGRRCATACSADSDCAPGAHCTAGTCAPDLAIGAACDRAAMCASGFCILGVCCDQLCDQPCSRCSAQSTPDGGAFPAGTCRPALNSALWTTCMPYLCSPTAIGCPTGCGQDADCFGTFCDSGGRCVPPLPVGAACSRDTQCGTKFCKDGVCCDTDCRGGCKTCLSDGGCSTQPDGVADPRCAGGEVCMQGECCNRPCTGACERCDTRGAPGVCSTVSGPSYACNSYYACQSDGGCAQSCTPALGCSTLGYCRSSVCEERCDPVACAQDNGKCCVANVCQPSVPSCAE